MGTRSLRRRLSIRLALVLAIAFVAASCSSSPDDDLDSAESNATVASETETSQTLADEPTTPDVPGAPLNPFDLRAGQCFNQGSWYDEDLERRIDLTASVGCDQPHQREMFHEADFPAPNGAPFPGETKMTEWSTQVCYEAFSTFVDNEYELSVYEIGFLQPTQATFEHEIGRHRRVTCYLFDPSQETKSGSAAGSGL